MFKSDDEFAEEIKYSSESIENPRPLPTRLNPDIIDERFHRFNRENKGISDVFQYESSSTSESECENDKTNLKEWMKISKAMIDSEDSERDSNEPKIKIEPNSSKPRTNRSRVKIKIKCSICFKTMLRSSFPKHVRKVHIGTNIGNALASSILLKVTNIDFKVEGDSNEPKIKIEPNSSKPRTNLSRVKIKIKCSICFKTMLRSNYRRHVKTVHPGTNIEHELASSILLRATNIDFKIEDDKIGIKNWMKIETSSKPRTNWTRKIKCSICFKIMLRSNYRRHVNTNHPGTNIGHELANSVLLKATNIVPSQCKSANSITNHRNVHEDASTSEKFDIADVKIIKEEKPTSSSIKCISNQYISRYCSICDIEFPNQNILREHMIGHKASESKRLTKIPCSICFRVLRDLEHFEKHKKLHADDSIKFQCQHCPLVFQKLHHLNFHLKTRHAGTSIPPIA